MVEVVYDNFLKAEYIGLFFKCVIRQIKLSSVDTAVKRLVANKERYELIADFFEGMPWIVVGVIHLMECNCNFNKQLHNGDPLTGRTTHVPSGRPPFPAMPPFSFEESAIDALTLRGFGKWNDWSIEGILWMLEQYNGLGYRQYHPTVLSPYLWSGTNLYSKGKYTADGRFSAIAVSQQLGCAAILKRALQLDMWDATANEKGVTQSKA
jgi:lysozyme family protein